MHCMVNGNILWLATESLQCKVHGTGNISLVPVYNSNAVQYANRLDPMHVYSNIIIL